MNLAPKKCSHCGSMVSPITIFREKLGLNQMQFAAKLGVRQHTMSRWESGNADPRGEIRDVIVALLEGRTKWR